MNKEQSEASVVIVGAGPTGVMLAIELARRGVEVNILDKQPARSPESRAIGIHARSLEVFHQLGIVEPFLELGHRVDGFTFHTQARGAVPIGFGRLDSPYPFLLTLSQAETQRILEKRLEDYGISVQRGVRVLDLHQEHDGVDLRTIRFGEERERALRASWVIGCDGAHSVARRSLGLRFEGDDYAQDWLMAEVNIDWPLARDNFHVFAHTALPLPVFPMPGGRWRVFVPQVADRPGDQQPPSFEEIEQLVAQRASAAVRLSEPGLLATFRCYRRSSQVMRAGRVLIAGDAAHIHSPAGGQGMNTGLQDAFNLGWKLALVVEGVAPESLLDSYAAERAPIAAGVLALTHGLVRTFTIASPRRRRWRDGALATAAAAPSAQRRYVTRLAQLSHNYRGGPLARATRRTRSIAAGDRLPPVAGLRRGDEAVSLLDLLRAPAHTLLVFSGRNPRPALTEDAVDRFSAWRMLVQTIVIGAQNGAADPGVVDPELRAHRRYGALRGRLVLVRPDGYVAATASLERPERLESYLRRLVNDTVGVT